VVPGDRLVCALVRPMMVGESFARWPLHVTIVPWFRLPDSSEMIASGLAQALATIQSFQVRADGEAMMGPRRQRHARLMQQPTPLSDIEQKVRTYLHKKRAWLVDETTKRKYQYRPHVTDQGSGALQEGDTFWCDRLYIIEQKGDYKEIMSEVHFE